MYVHTPLKLLLIILTEERLRKVVNLKEEQKKEVEQGRMLISILILTETFQQWTNKINYSEEKDMNTMATVAFLFSQSILIN